MPVILILANGYTIMRRKTLHLERRIELTGQSLRSPEATVGGNNSINERKGGREYW
jgi:hypothetical protein